MKAPTKKLFERLTALIFPDENLQIEPKLVAPPQEFVREEVKVEASFTEDVTKECNSFENDVNALEVA